MILTAESKQQQALLNEETEKFEAVFTTMDVDCDDQVTKEEFARFLHMHHNQWPLGELLSTATDGMSTTIVNFWFSKILPDAHASTFERPDLFDFLTKMGHPDYREEAYAELLFRCFDSNFDGKLSRQEYEKMLSTLLGESPTTASLLKVPEGGMNQGQLKALLKSVHCDFRKLVVKPVKKESSGLVNVFVFVVLGLSAAAGGAVVWQILKRKK